MGSVKDLLVLEAPHDSRPGRAYFVFSDRYSVFDWGRMPDDIKNKGYSLCLSSAYFFERLEGMGIKTHYTGLIEGGKLKCLSELSSPVNTMEIKLLRVLKPTVHTNTYDYSIYRKEKINFLIPLEIIYRNYLPEGSSVFKRLKENRLKLEDLGLKEMPVPGQALEKPILDVSTKLEAVDRYISWDEAKEIAGLDDSEIRQIKQVTLTINNLITQEVEKVGLRHEDGKVEFGFDENRNLILVDAVGTLDECRFTYNGLPVSKEIARIYYRNTRWYEEIEDAKKMDPINWKDIVKIAPEPLPSRVCQLISYMYCAFVNEIAGRQWFKGIPPLAHILEEISQLVIK